MKKLLSIAAVILTLASCSSVTSELSSTVKARLQPTIFDINCSCYKGYGNRVEVHVIDNMYKVGDVVCLKNEYYMVLSTDGEPDVKGDYQLDVYQDSTVIWDGNRHVSTLKFDSTQALDNVILDDNQ